MQSYQYFQTGGGVTLKVLSYNVLREIEKLKTEKADKDLSNVTAEGKAAAVSWGIPDYANPIATVTLSNNVLTEVIAPQNCFLRLHAQGDSGVDCLITNDLSRTADIVSFSVPSGSITLNGWVYLAKGHSVCVRGASGSSTNRGIFYTLFPMLGGSNNV